ncbi:MAG TPA: RsmG family class I SAM-dependent methyltransferase [Kofleriaceae bacterium]|nr:RsmG family class I SAM-dependent methyltransferase [Kofleriaceae bacterium]
MSWTDELNRAAGAHGVPVARARLLVGFVERFVRWNQKINLSAARTPDEVARQVIDCLALLPFVEDGKNVIDVGSGGGLPGAILALVRDVRVTSLEPVNKKAAFQSSIARELGAPLDVRAERADPQVHRDFDIAVSRATFDLLEWLELGRQLIRPGGLVLGMEGREIHSLPSGAERHPYEHGDRTRAVITYRPS